MTLWDWGHVIAAVLWAVVAIFVARRSNCMRLPGFATVATVATAAHFLVTAVTPRDVVQQATWIIATACWIFTLWHMRSQSAQAIPGSSDNSMAYRALWGGLGAQSLLSAAIILAGTSAVAPALLATFHSFGAVVAIGMLVLIYELQVAAGEASQLRNRGFLLTGLTALFGYVLMHAVFMMLTPSASSTAAIKSGEGWFAAAVAPVVWLSLLRLPERNLRISRTLTMKTAMALTLCAYLVSIFIAVVGASRLPDASARLVQIGTVFGLSVGALVILPSARFRAWIRVEIAKHFFTHRYDYRTEWLHFAQTLGQETEGDSPIAQRVVRAIAHIVGASGGQLLAVDGDGRLAPWATWRWRDDHPVGIAAKETTAAHLAETGWIVDLDNDDERARFGIERLGNGDAWLAVPLIHYNRPVAIMLIGRPAVQRPLDWEDLDILRVASRHAASYLSEAQAIARQNEAARFQEFNRRFAFIMHDIKNLVSQMSVLARNAERHADNPAFRADMILTLRESSTRMTDMIARLSCNDRQERVQHDQIDIAELVSRVAERKSVRVRIDDQADGGSVLGDRYALEEAIGHIIQNAIDASGPDGVDVVLVQSGAWLNIGVTDDGPGMSADFIRADLFRPFTSTKSNGFGIGAHEARSIFRAHRGDITVESRVGEGSCFTLSLPVAEQKGVWPRIANG